MRLGAELDKARAQDLFGATPEIAGVLLHMGSDQLQVVLRGRLR